MHWKNIRKGKVISKEEEPVEFLGKTDTKEQEMINRDIRIQMEAKKEAKISGASKNVTVDYNPEIGEYGVFDQGDIIFVSANRSDVDKFIRMYKLELEK